MDSSPPWFALFGVFMAVPMGICLISAKTRTCTYTRNTRKNGKGGEEGKEAGENVPDFPAAVRGLLLRFKTSYTYVGRKRACVRHVREAAKQAK